MANIDEGPIVSQIRGSTAEYTFSKNQFGPFVCTKINPAYPDTTRQQQANSALTGIIVRWQQLDDSERASWNEDVESGGWVLTNSLGREYRPSGYQLFVQLNLSGAYFAVTFDTPPSKVQMPALRLVSFSTSPSTPSHDSNIQVAGDSFDSNFRLLLFTSDSMSLGRTKPKSNFFRWTNGYSYGDLSGGINYKFSWAGVWGNNTDPDRIFIKAYMVSLSSGQRTSLGWLGNFS